MDSHKKRTKSICLLSGLIFLAFFLIVPSTYATNGMQVIGHGPIMRAMGGAGSALPQDSAVIMVNPSGISALDARIDVNVTYFVPKSSFRATHTPAMGGEDYNNGSDTGPSFMAGFGVVAPLNDDITFGVGAYGVAGMGTDYPLSIYNNVVYTSFEMMKFAPAVSYKINKMFSVGAAANIDYATLRYRAGRNTNNRIVNHDRDSQVGFGYQVGGTANFMEMFSASIGYISAQEFPEFEFTTTGDDTNGNALGYIDTMNFDLPQMVVGGLGFNYKEKFKVAIDVKFIEWSKTMGINSPTSHRNESGSPAWSCSWDDQTIYAIGLEYGVLDNLRARVGYNYGQHPLEANRAFENIAFPALVESHYTAGFGWDITDKITVDIAYMYAPEVELTGANSENPPNGQGITSYTSSLEEWSMDFGLSYKF